MHCSARPAGQSGRAPPCSHDLHAGFGAPSHGRACSAAARQPAAWCCQAGSQGQLHRLCDMQRCCPGGPWPGRGARKLSQPEATVVSDSKERKSKY